MNFASKVSILLITAGTLAVATTSPRNTYRILSKPSRMIAAHKLELRHQKSLAEWKDRLQRAEGGDPAAMARVGQVMNRAHHYQWTGIAPDTVKGTAYIRAAAAAGDPDGMLSEWILDGKGALELAELSKRILDQDLDTRILANLSGWLSWYSVENCSAELRDAERKAVEAMIKLQPQAIEAIRAQQSSYESDFSQTCPVAST